MNVLLWDLGWQRRWSRKPWIHTMPPYLSASRLIALQLATWTTSTSRGPCAFSENPWFPSKLLKQLSNITLLPSVSPKDSDAPPPRITQVHHDKHLTSAGFYSEHRQQPLITPPWRLYYVQLHICRHIDVYYAYAWWSFAERQSQINADYTWGIWLLRCASCEWDAKLRNHDVGMGIVVVLE